MFVGNSSFSLSLSSSSSSGSRPAGAMHVGDARSSSRYLASHGFKNSQSGRRNPQSLAVRFCVSCVRVRISWGRLSCCSRIRSIGPRTSHGKRHQPPRTPPPQKILGADAATGRGRPRQSPQGQPHSGELADPADDLSNLGDERRKQRSLFHAAES